MAFKCPVPGCEDSEKEFQTETARKSHIRNKHPEFMEDESMAREVPIVEEDFATLLKKFKIKGDLAINIAENISHTGGARVFEDPEIIYKRLAAWSSDIPPAKRKLILEQWFAERGVDIPPEIQQRAGMTPEQIHKAEAGTKEAAEVRYIFDTEVRLVRMAKEGERGGTLAQARELKKMAEEDAGAGSESPFMQNAEGQWVLNPKARVTGVELMAVQFMQQSQAKGEPIDPITAMTQAADRWKALREGLGVGAGASALPTWMTDPAAFIETVRTISGGKGEDSTLKEALATMQKSMEEMKEDRWREQFSSQQKQMQELANVVNKTLESIADLQKGRVGRTEMDILHEIAEKGIDLAKTELPGLRRDIKDMVGSVALPPGKTSEQREDRKKKFKQAIDTDRDIEELGRRVFFQED